jgi:acyl dehydratase
MSVSLSDAVVGSPLPTQTFQLDRSSMIRYAGASGDFNPIHWDEAFAREVGLPSVIVHGMLTMGLAVRVVTDWVGDPAAVLEYGVRFTRPVVVPAGRSVQLAVAGAVRSVDAAGGTAVIDLTATVNGETVLARARATVRLAPT